jgi:hypothetical protein
MRSKPDRADRQVISDAWFRRFLLVAILILLLIVVSVVVWLFTYDLELDVTFTSVFVW